MQSKYALKLTIYAHFQTTYTNISTGYKLQIITSYAYIIQGHNITITL